MFSDTLRYVTSGSRAGTRRAGPAPGRCHQSKLRPAGPGRRRPDRTNRPRLHPDNADPHRNRTRQRKRRPRRPHRQVWARCKRISLKTQSSFNQLCRYCATIGILFMLLQDWTPPRQVEMRTKQSVMIKSNTYMIGNKICNMNNQVQYCQFANLHSKIIPLQ